MQTDKDKIIEIRTYLREMISSFYGYGKYTPVTIELTLDKIIELEQLLSTEPEAMGEETALSKKIELNRNIDKFLKDNEPHKELFSGLNNYQKGVNVGFIKGVREYTSYHHPKPVDEPKQLPNTTEGMSEEDEVKLIIKLDIIYARETSEISGLTFSKGDMAEAVRIGEHYDKQKLDVIKSLTSNNQQTEGWHTDKCNFPECEFYENINWNRFQCRRCTKNDTPQPQKADSEQGEPIRHVYNSILFETNDTERLALCMRDSGYEFKYEGIWYEAKNGKVNKLSEQTNKTK